MKEEKHREHTNQASPLTETVFLHANKVDFLWFFKVFEYAVSALKIFFVTLFPCLLLPPPPFNDIVGGVLKKD